MLDELWWRMTELRRLDVKNTEERLFHTHTSDEWCVNFIFCLHRAIRMFILLCISLNNYAIEISRAYTIWGPLTLVREMKICLHILFCNEGRITWKKRVITGVELCVLLMVNCIFYRKCTRWIFNRTTWCLPVFRNAWLYVIKNPQNQ